MRRLLESRRHVTAEGKPYKPIDSRNSEIRLAILEPGYFTDAISVKLRTASIQQGTLVEYEALSYAWGKDMCPNRAIVSGIIVSISENLDCALRHLRSQDKPRILWIDALCIDQSNVSERNQQVQMMNRIYSTASQVLIWLGPADADEMEVISYMRGERKMKSWSLCDHHAMTRICQRAWFSRVWVVQELALAKSDPLVHLGFETFTWSRFSMFIRHASDGNMHWKFTDVAPLGEDLHFQFWNAAKCIISLTSLRDKVDIWTFVDQIAHTGEFQATDPRDKVFGILAMSASSDCKHNIKVEYEKRTREVFTEATFRCVEVDPVTLYQRVPLQPRLKIHDNDYTRLSGLPSWAMDLTVISRKPDDGHWYYRPMTLWGPNIHWTTNKLHSKKITGLARLGANNHLHTVGVELGIIAQTSRDLLFSNHDSFHVPGANAISAPTLRIIYETMIKPNKISGSDYLEALCAGTDDWWYLNDECSDAFWSLLADENASKEDFVPTEMQASVLSRLAKTCENMVLFVTTEGRVGLSYHPDPIHGIIPGDIIAGLFGDCLTFVLRRLGSTGRHLMINIAFLQGHVYKHEKIKGAAEGTTADEVWQDMEAFGVQEYALE